ncbi:MAG: pancreas/duodenum homeobox protein 1, partial [Deltaproteobacteria bacterium]|nr:pancreas/duodenum homeobox protein 1 [Deltaproteobacteria bacterium]
MTANGALKYVFTQDDLEKLFPVGRSDAFFESLFGGAEEGAFDIGLAFKAHRGNELHFEFQLRQRPGKCLACNLTYG